jgi:hypothetical protein
LETPAPALAAPASEVDAPPLAAPALEVDAPAVLAPAAEAPPFAEPELGAPALDDEWSSVAEPEQAHTPNAQMNKSRLGNRARTHMTAWYPPGNYRQARLACKMDRSRVCYAR